MSNQKKPTKAESPSSSEVTLKVRFSAAEHKLLKMAAAELEITIADLMKTATMDCAKKAIDSYVKRESAQKKG